MASVTSYVYEIRLKIRGPFDLGLSHLIKAKTKRWFKARIAYYPNSVATFNFNALTISLSGDVHPLPGSISRSTCKIPVTCTDRKRKDPLLSHM